MSDESMATEVIYAGFVKRAVALFIDAMVYLPFLPLHFYLFNKSPVTAVISSALSSGLYTIYLVMCHGRWGQTLGKYVTGIVVRRTDFSPIGYREAVLRESVMAGLVASAILAAIVSFATREGPAWSSLTDEQRVEAFARGHSLSIIIDYLTQAWFWSEVVVILFNDKRRAFHDFIAGTVVIHKKRREVIPAPLKG